MILSLLSGDAFRAETDLARQAISVCLARQAGRFTNSAAFLLAKYLARSGNVRPSGGVVARSLFPLPLHLPPRPQEY